MYGFNKFGWKELRCIGIGVLASHIRTDNHSNLPMQVMSVVIFIKMEESQMGYYCQIVHIDSSEYIVNTVPSVICVR